MFPSPHPGIINFFRSTAALDTNIRRFRPLIRGLSISSGNDGSHHRDRSVSVPSSGDYQFLLIANGLSDSLTTVSVPSSGDYQFLLVLICLQGLSSPSFRPLIRGLSISSQPAPQGQPNGQVSVPSSGDYQFLRISQSTSMTVTSFRPLIRGLSISSANFKLPLSSTRFPSPHPGIINFFFVRHARQPPQSGFRPLIRGLSISSKL